MIHSRLIHSTIAAVICGALNAAPAFCADPESVFKAYLDAILSNQWEKAESCWLPEVIEKSKRLGIRYAGIEAKYDCASRLFPALDGIRSGRVHLEALNPVIHKNWALLPVRLTAESDSVEIPYHVVKSNGRWKLATALQVHAGAWRKILTRYATVYFQDSTLINEIALAELDDFIVRMCDHLGIADSKRKQLEREKIDYYLCNEADIEKLTGHSCQGMTNLQEDAIVTRHLPHYHELVHLLINFTLSELPLYTQPFIQEGLAVAYGGRWGKSAPVLFQLGNFLLEHGFVELNALLTFDGFHRQVGNPDLSYPVSGLFVKFLIEEVGMERFKALYLNLSGSDRDIRDLTSADVQSKIEDAIDTQWPAVEESFLQYWTRYQDSGILPGGSPPPGEPSADIQSANLAAHIWDEGRWFYFQIHSKSDHPEAVVLMKDQSFKAGSYQSRNFAEHLPTADYQGEMYGIQFTASEVGLYYYPTNSLLAKYVLSLTPCDEYWDAEKQAIRFRLDKRLLKKNLPDMKLHLVEP